MRAIATKTRGATKKTAAPSAAAASAAAALKLKRQRPDGWRGALVTDELTSGSVSVRAIAGDDSCLPFDSPILWSVGVTIHHDRAAESLYLKPSGEQYANPTNHVHINVDIAHPRGGEDGRVKGTTIDCELGHVDSLLEALYAALTIGRRDGTIPIAKGIPPWKPRGFLPAKSA
jgi:hypothetical protein